MAGAASGGAKRARVAALSAHERYMHKSGVVLQREGKKIRAFLVRKAVAQLKQTRDQHATAQAAVADASAVDAAKRKRLEGKAKKLFHQVDKHEKELAALKTLDLKAVVVRAFEKTGLRADEPQHESDDDDDDDAKRSRPMSAHEREMAKYGRGRVVADHRDHERAEPTAPADEDDDGFNSEDYDEVPRSEASNSEKEEEDESEEHDESEDDGEGRDETASGDDDEQMEEDGDEELQVVQAEEVEEGAVLFGPVGPPGDDQAAGESKDEKETSADRAMIEQLIERVLTHNQMKAFLDAIRQYVEKKEREEAKKRRQKEKSALKRARASMVGGRSSAAPKSMFFGSLSGDAPDDDDDDTNVGFGRASMAGAEDDIADFLGETKKKKNRPGQMARRQKAIRMEEARRIEEEGAGGFQKRRFNSRDAPATGKYGPSERPKKQQKKDGPPSRGAKQRGDGDRSSSWKDRNNSSGASARGAGNREFNKPSVEDKRQERRARADAAPKARPAAPQRKPEVEPSHPSWVAKQALKEKMKVDINAFSGKKITFGDD